MAITRSHVVTELGNAGTDRVVETRLDCTDNSLLIYRTIWSPADDDMNHVVRRRAEFGIGGVSIPLQSGPTPIDHVTVLRDSGMTTSETSAGATVDLTDVTHLFLANREDGCEVFLDEPSARFWARSASNVRQVSVRAACSALKVDRETVLESAVAASAAAWSEIHLLLSIIQFASSARDQLCELGLSSLLSDLVP
ncbi:MAG: hypothetical protein QXS20_07175 [Candidatus Thorarchaeota archaeon]